MEKNDVVQAYSSMRSGYESLCEEVADLLMEALDNNHIEYAGVSERAKTIESFRDKIARKEYDDPLEQVEDLAGVRVVCLYDDDRARIVDICTKEFEVIRVEDRGRDLGADRMGYSGTHLIVRLGGAFSGGRYRGITQLKCEIQIRTAVQDAWAMISHGMVYKHEQDVPLELRRDLNHAAALLEIAQTKFDELRVKREQYLEEITTDLASEAPTEAGKLLDRKINFDTLTAYIRWKFPELQPDDKLTRMVIQDINKNRFRKIADIDKLVDRARPAVDAYRNEASEYFRNATDFITKSLGFANEEFRKKHGFGPKTREAFPRFDHLVLSAE